MKVPNISSTFFVGEHQVAFEPEFAGVAVLVRGFSKRYIVGVAMNAKLFYLLINEVL